MTAPTVDELLVVIRHLPMAERLRLIDRATEEATADTPPQPKVRESAQGSLLGLMADEPDIVDEMCSLAYAARGEAQMRAADE